MQLTARDSKTHPSDLLGCLLHRFTTLIFTTSALALSISVAFSGEYSSTPSVPNIILILADDQGYGDIRSHDNDQIDTPVLDRLAGDGARFERFFVSPVCAPTRAALLTGRYHPRGGVHGVTRGYENLRAEEVTIAEVLKQAGYVTGCFGKWHNGRHWPMHPNGQGFDEFLGFCGGHWNRYFDTTLEHNGQPVETKGYVADVLTDAAIDFVRQNRERSFFCYVPYNTPHSPWLAPDEYFNKYKAKGLDNTTACAYAMCENLDHNIGRLLKELDELKLSEQTIVFFLTDNGPNSDRYNGGMKGRKGSLHEGGVRVPLFVRWPGHIEPQTVVKPITAHIDLLPTIVELCGLEKSSTRPLDGVSLAPLLCGQDQDWPERMIFNHGVRTGGVEGRHGAARSQRWRAVHYRRGWELYDMQADPGQIRNVAKQFPEVLKRHADAFYASFADVTKRGFDPISIPLGYPQRPWVELPGNEAFLETDGKQGIRYHGKQGYANDWISGWTDTKAYAWWPLDVVEAGHYAVTLRYCCKPENVGAKLRVEADSSGVEAVVNKAHDPAVLPSRERVTPSPHYETKSWAELTLGQLDLPKGPVRLTVRTIDKPGDESVELKAVLVRRVE